MATTKRNSRILDEMHETARGLHSVGLISKRRMGEFHGGLVFGKSIVESDFLLGHPVGFTAFSGCSQILGQLY